MTISPATTALSETTDAETTGVKPPGAQAPERVAGRMLEALRSAPALAIFDWQDAETAPPKSAAFQPSAAELDAHKVAADLLVASRLAAFSDASRTQLSITNAGRYWALHGGYLGFLKEQPAGTVGGGGGRQRNPEMEALRSEYMKLRLNTFWWSFGLSVAGFIMSIASVAIAVFYGDRLLR